ncbi:MAG: ribonuclease HII [Deltaproteobacteria bacterium]|nr:ribonuclease HII [Deltaproteobacteria bacterium]MBW2120767.1 ribonuclease HII [Deltaproteobacteria bacterium]
MSRNRPGDLFASPWGQPMDFFERRFLSQGFRSVAGVDEAGRGPLAGPVVAAAVILSMEGLNQEFRDSKRLLPAKRESLYGRILETALAVGIGVVEAEEIDRINIGRATQKAMLTAVHCLRVVPGLLLIDGVTPIPISVPQRTIVRGDNLSVSIAAASIIAKVTRDRIMVAYDERYPQYDFAKHKGYGTLEHREAIRRHGYCECHRKSFRGVTTPVASRV